MGRTQTIQYAELQNIIDRRVEQNNRQWLDLMAKIGRAGLVTENLTKQYPLSAMELAAEVKRAFPRAGQNQIWQIVRESGLKGKTDYAAYNFRNKRQEDEFRESGVLPPLTPTIYNRKAVDYIVNILKSR